MSVNHKFEVKKGIPMPARQRGAGLKKTSGVKLDYPFDKMAVTDCIIVPIGVNWKPVYSSAWQYGERHGMRFECRTIAEGMGIWRVE